MPPKDFSQLTDEEAQEVFQRHVAGHPERIEAFRRMFPDPERLDFTPESLVPVWEWFLGRDEGGGELPDWYEPDPPELASQRLSPATLRDVDLVAAYLAEVFLRSVDGLEWGIGSMPKRMQYVHQSRPVLQRGELDIEPVSIVYGRAIEHALMGGTRNPEALLENYRAWLET